MGAGGRGPGGRGPGTSAALRAGMGAGDWGAGARRFAAVELASNGRCPRGWHEDAALSGGVDGGGRARVPGVDVRVASCQRQPMGTADQAAEAGNAEFARVYGGSDLKILQFYARDGNIVEGTNR